MRNSIFLILLVIAAAMTFCAACTGTDSVQQTTAATTAATQATQTVEATTAAESSDMTPGPTELPEKKYQTEVQVNKDEVFGTITVIFRGGLGQNFIYTQVVDVYYPDGRHETQDLGTNVGDEAEFEGTKNLQDRVKVTTTYMGSIGTYVVYDSLVPAKRKIPNP
jgi:uncharacterized cupredoxin-like copper-binding protein